MEQAEKPKPPEGEDTSSHPARELSLHMLRMLETRLDAAGIVLHAESQRLVSRLQWALLSAATLFIAVWGGIVLLAIALPPDLRVPVLSAVVATFVVTAVVAFVLARRMVPGRKVGSLAWFLEGLKLDLEVLARSLSQPQPQSAPPPDQQRKPPDDIAA